MEKERCLWEYQYISKSFNEFQAHLDVCSIKKVVIYYI